MCTENTEKTNNEPDGEIPFGQPVRNTLKYIIPIKIIITNFQSLMYAREIKVITKLLRLNPPIVDFHER